MKHFFNETKLGTFWSHTEKISFLISLGWEQNSSLAVDKSTFSLQLRACQVLDCLQLLQDLFSVTVGWRNRRAYAQNVAQSREKALRPSKTVSTVVSRINSYLSAWRTGDGSIEPSSWRSWKLCATWWCRCGRVETTFCHGRRRCWVFAEDKVGYKRSIFQTLQLVREFPQLAGAIFARLRDQFLARSCRFYKFY